MAVELAGELNVSPSAVSKSVAQGQSSAHEGKFDELLR